MRNSRAPKGLWLLLVVIAALAMVASGSGRAYAWWSVTSFNSSTHLKVATAAFSLLDPGQYPDLARFRDLGVLRPGGIQAWMSGPGDDENAHGKKYRDDAGKFDGGPIESWWGVNKMYPSDGILPQYKAFNFDRPDQYSAYYYLALMAHLVGDQAVPAHAANIFHLQPVKELPADPLWGDNFENYANSEEIRDCRYCHSTVPIPAVNGIPVDYYHSIKGEGALDKTQAGLPGWKDHRGISYWVANPEYSGDAFDERWGHYQLGPLSDDAYIKILDDQDLVKRQLDVAVAYTAGVLRAASMSLPPLVKDLSLTSRPLDPTFEADIRLTLMENRTPNVFVTLRAVSEADQSDSYVLSVDGSTWDAHQVYLYDGDQLPFEKDVVLAWKGYGRSEKTGKFVALPDGDYLMTVLVADEDGNEVNAVYPTINADEVSANDTAVPFQITTQPPDMPTAFVAMGNDSSVNLSWVAPTTSLYGSALPDLAGFRLWRRDEHGASCSGDSDVFHGVIYCKVASESALRKSVTSYVDRDVTAGVTYTYVLQAVDVGGNVSPPTEGAAARPFPALWVPGEYASISAALAAAGSGDVVMVRPGVYYEEKLTIGRGGTSMSYDAENVVLMSERGPAFTVIESHAREFLIGAGDSTAIVGFTLRNHPAAYAAILCFFDNEVLVANNVFVSNRIGVYAGGNDGSRVYNNTFVGNTTATLVAGFGSMDVRNNIFVGNATAANIHEAYGRAAVEYNDFHDNGVDVVRHYDSYLGRYDDLVSSNYSFDPRFVNYSAVFPGHSNYRLREGSPAEDRGDPRLVLLRSENDWLAADLRWRDADGTAADLGAFGGPLTSMWATDDHDADGIPDSLDSDDDNDCLADDVEDADGDGLYDSARETNPLDADSDDDGLTDGNCGSEDLNANGMWDPDQGETDPRQADSDGDGIPDGTETGLPAPEGMDTDLALYVPDLDPGTTTDPLNADTDLDGVSDGVEDADRNGRRDDGETDPRVGDTDGDSYSDGAEMAGGSDPLNAESTPNHPPEVVITSVAQRKDGSGVAEIGLVGTDAEGDRCQLEVEVSRDGARWQPVEPLRTDPSHTAASPMAFSPDGTASTFVWDTHGTLGAVEDPEVFVRLRATDGVIPGEYVASQPFVVDNVAPSLTVSVPEVTNVAVLPVLLVEDGVDATPAVTAFVDGDPWSGNAVEAEGVHTFSVTARDGIGNVGSVERRFTVDRTPPTVHFEGVADGGRYDVAVTVGWHVRDAIDPAPRAAASVASPYTFSTSGYHSVTVTASDAAGNTSVRSCSFGIFRLEDLLSVVSEAVADPGLRDSLQAKVANALESRDRGNANAAVNQLEAFIHAVAAQSGKKIAPSEAMRLEEFALEVIALLQSSWDSLALGEVVLAGDDPALANPVDVIENLERNAVSRVILEAYRVEDAAAGVVSAEGLSAFLDEAERRGMEVIIGMNALTGGIDPEDPEHLRHLREAAAALIVSHPSASALLVADVEAPGKTAAVTAMIRAIGDAARERGLQFAVRIPCPAHDEDLSAFAAARGVDLIALGGLADTLYLDLGAIIDGNGDGVQDRDPTEIGDAVESVGRLGLPAALAVVVPTGDTAEPFEDLDADGLFDDGEAFTDLDGDGRWDVVPVQTPEQITATLSALPGDMITGIAVCRYADTSAAEWEAFLNGNPR